MSLAVIETNATNLKLKERRDSPPGIPVTELKPQSCIPIITFIYRVLYYAMT